jgi:hypothetical protein
MFQLDVIDRTGVKEIFLDQGFNDRDAEIQTRLIEKQRANAQKLPGVQQTRRTILASYRLGTISEEFAKTQLFRLTKGTLADVQAFDALPADARKQQAESDPGVAQAVLEADAEVNLAEAKEKLATIKRRRLKGIISETQARQQLTAAGFDAGAIQRYIRTWRVLLDEHKRQLSTASVLKYARYGILSATQASDRLKNLGWSADDVALLLADVQRNVNLDTAKRLLAIARTAKQQEQALKAQAKAAVAQAKAAQRELASHGSPSQLVKWLTLGLLDPGTFAARLGSLGWPDEDVQRMIAEALAERARQLAARAPKIPKPKPIKVSRANVQTLLKWAKLGILSETEFRARLVNLGYPPLDVDHYVKQAYPQSQGSSSNGQSATQTGTSP